MGTVYIKTGLTGGVAGSGPTDGDLDGIDGADLADSDFAFCYVNRKAYFYKLNATSGATESSPDIIAPDLNPGTKRWEMQASVIGTSDIVSTSGDITLDLESQNHDVTLTGTSTLVNPSNIVAGQSGVIVIKKTATRSLSFGTYWDFSGGAPTLTAGATTDVISYFIQSTTSILCTMIKDV